MRQMGGKKRTETWKSENKPKKKRKEKRKKIEEKGKQTNIYG